MSKKVWIEQLKQKLLNETPDGRYYLEISGGGIWVGKAGYVEFQTALTAMMYEQSGLNLTDDMTLEEVEALFNKKIKSKEPKKDPFKGKSKYF